MRFGVVLLFGVICAGIAGVAACIGDDSSDGGPNAGPDAGNGADATPSTDDASTDAGGTDATDAADANTVMPCKSESSTRTILAQTADAGIQFNDVWMTHVSPTKIAIITGRSEIGKNFLLYTFEPGDAGAPIETAIDTGTGVINVVPNAAHDGFGVIGVTAPSFDFTLHEIDANGGDVLTHLVHPQSNSGAALLALGPAEWWFAFADETSPGMADISIGHVKSGVVDGVTKVGTAATAGSHTLFRTAVRAGDRVLLFDDSQPDFVTNAGSGTSYWDLPVDTSTATTTTAKIVGPGPSTWIVVGAAAGTGSGAELAIAENQPDPNDPDFMRVGKTTSSAIDPSMLPKSFDARWTIDVPFRIIGNRSRMSDHANFLWVGTNPRLGGRGFDVYWYDYGAGALRARSTEIFGDRLGTGYLDAEFVSTPTATSGEIDVVWIDQKSSLAYTRVKCAR